MTSKVPLKVACRAPDGKFTRNHPGSRGRWLEMVQSELGVDKGADDDTAAGFLFEGLALASLHSIKLSTTQSGLRTAALIDIALRDSP